MRNTVSPEQTDADLLRLSEKGNEAAFLSLYRRHQGAVFRFAAHMCGRTEIAEEVVQDVFISLLSRPGAFRPDLGSLEAYLIGMARNFVRRHLSEIKPREMKADVFPAAATPFDRLSQDQELHALQSAILSLPVPIARWSCCAMCRKKTTRKRRASWDARLARYARAFIARGRF